MSSSADKGRANSPESLEDLKAAFVCVNNGIDAHFSTPEDLAKGKLLEIR